LASKLADCTVVITRKVGDEDRLFGSVTNADIAENLQAQGIAVDKKLITLQAPIKTIGETVVLVKAGYKTSAELTVHVMPESTGEITAEAEEEVVTDAEQEPVETAVTEESSTEE
jgi:large subunit ribosomal protein L9